MEKSNKNETNKEKEEKEKRKKKKEWFCMTNTRNTIALLCVKDSEIAQQ